MPVYLAILLCISSIPSLIAHWYSAQSRIQSVVTGPPHRGQRPYTLPPVPATPERRLCLGQTILSIHSFFVSQQNDLGLSIFLGSQWVRWLSLLASSTRKKLPFWKNNSNKVISEWASSCVPVFRATLPYLYFSSTALLMRLQQNPVQSISVPKKMESVVNDPIPSRPHLDGVSDKPGADYWFSVQQIDLGARVFLISLWGSRSFLSASYPLCSSHLDPVKSPNPSKRNSERSTLWPPVFKSIPLHQVILDVCFHSEFEKNPIRIVCAKLQARTNSAPLPVCFFESSDDSWSAHAVVL